MEAARQRKNMERVYVNGEHSSVLMKSMAKLWKERKYCDAVLDVNSENIEVMVSLVWATSWEIKIKKKKKSSFKSNENIHKKEDGSYYVVSANRASSVTL